MFKSVCICIKYFKVFTVSCIYCVRTLVVWKQIFHFRIFVLNVVQSLTSSLLFYLLKFQAPEYLVHLDKQAEGMKLLEQAIEQSRRNPEILYFKALALLQEDDTEQALSLLQEAVTLEQNYQQLIALDPDLKRLQNDPRFMSLMPNSSL